MEIIKVLSGYRVSIDPRMLRWELWIISFWFGAGVSVGIGVVSTHTNFSAAKEAAHNRYLLEQMSVEADKYAREASQCISKYPQ